MKRIKKTIILLACVLSAGIASAQVAGTPYIVPTNVLPPNICQGSSTKGTDFWVSFGENFSFRDATKVLLQLKISADQSADVTLTFTATGGTYTFTEGGGALTTIDLSSVPGLGDMRDYVYLYQAATGVAYNKTLHITSTTPVSVYAINISFASNDATVVLPVDAWGSDYYRLSYIPLINNGKYDVEMIIANQNNTSIFLNSTTLATINQGQIYVVTSTNDMTGRHITTNKPVAYFTHNTGVNIPVGRTSGDCLFEQMMPVSAWGQQFLVPSAPGDSYDFLNNHIRIVASQNGTTVSYSGATFFPAEDLNGNIYGGVATFSPGATLNAGQWVELEINGTAASTSCYINASKPVGVAAYMTGANSGTLGDPSIAWIPPLNQSMQSVTISPFMFPQGTASTAFGQSTAKHYMLVIASTAKKDQTTSNGAPLAGWTDNAASGYSFCLYYFDNTADVNKIFTVANPAGVLVLCGGIAPAESYYYNAGSGACIVN